jgi:hypothetical protein
MANGRHAACRSGETWHVSLLLPRVGKGLAAARGKPAFILLQFTAMASAGREITKGKIHMMKSAIAVAALLAFAAPAFADDMKCDDAAMTKMKTDMDAVTDAAKKEAGMKQMEMAMAAMKDGKADDCMAAMKAAMDAVK